MVRGREKGQERNCLGTNGGKARKGAKKGKRQSRERGNDGKGVKTGKLSKGDLLTPLLLQSTSPGDVLGIGDLDTRGWHPFTR